MDFHHARAALIPSFALMLFGLQGCVTVNLPKTSQGKSHEVILQEPTRPFLPLKTAKADRAWKSEKNGATISFLSDCNDDPNSLRNFEADSLNSMSGSKLVERKTQMVSEREALRLTIKGETEGIKMHLETLAFRRNGCDFVLTLVSKEQSADENRGAFESFIQGFRAP